MKISKECMDEARTALKDFSKQELKEYAFDVFERAKKFTNMSNMRAFDEAMKEINNDRLKSFFESAMTAANNAMKIESAADRIRKYKANLQNTMIKRHANQGDNVEAAQRAAQETIEGSFFNKVTREEVTYLSTGENDLLIADSFDGKKVDSKEANTIAKLWKDVYFPERNAELITSNAIPFEHINEDRSFRNVHDSNKLIMGGRSAINEARSEGKFTTERAKKKWIETIKKRFNLIHSDATLPDGSVDEERLNKIIGDMYDKITTGESDIFTRSLVVNDRVAVQNRSRRRLQPKSMRDFVEYNKEYGQGNLMSAMLTDMQSSGNKIGMARILGDSPHAAYLDLKKVQQEKDPKGGFWMYNADLYFQQVSGSNRTAVHPRLAAFDANTRAVSAMARLPLVALRSFPDINNMAVFAMNHGYNYFEAWGTHLKNTFDLYPSAQRKYLAKRYATMFRQHLGYMARFGEVNNISERLNKISTAYFKWNMLHSFDDGNKMSGLQIVARGIGRNSSKTFDQLPLATKNWIERFLSPQEWELLRGKTKDKLFTVDNVDALSEKEIKDFHDAGDKLRPLHEVRNDLFRRVHAMSQIATENMVLNPGAFERAWLLQGTKPGTVTGTLTRQLSHFKGYTFSFLDKILVQGYRNADANQQKLAWATAMLVGSLPLSYGVMFLENAAMGKSMPDITRMNINQAEKFLVELIVPSLALFTGVLDPKHQNSDMVMSLLASPSLRLMGNALSTFISAGNVTNKNYGKNLLKHFIDTMSYVIPIKTTPILSPYLKELMGEKGNLEPGQKHYFGR